MAGYIDAHNHLHDARLDAVRQEALNALEGDDWQGMVVNGTCEDDWAEVARLAEAHPKIIPAFGLHPWKCDGRSPAWFEKLETWMNTPRATLGEVGLDKWMRNANINDQRDVFQQQLALAGKLNRPVSIHCLQAWGHLKEILAQTNLPPCGFLLHAYSGPREMVSTFLDYGALFSFSGYFLHDRKENRRSLFAKLPESCLLVETDAPDMCLPDKLDPYRQRFSAAVNHPCNIEINYRELAEIRGCPLTELKETVAANFRRLFH